MIIDKESLAIQPVGWAKKQTEPNFGLCEIVIGFFHKSID